MPGSEITEMTSEELSKHLSDTNYCHYFAKSFPITIGINPCFSAMQLFPPKEINTENCFIFNLGDWAVLSIPSKAHKYNQRLQKSFEITLAPATKKLKKEFGLKENANVYIMDGKKYDKKTEERTLQEIIDEESDLIDFMAAPSANA